MDLSGGQQPSALQSENATLQRNWQRIGEGDEGCQWFPYNSLPRHLEREETSLCMTGLYEATNRSEGQLIKKSSLWGSTSQSTGTWLGLASSADDL